MKLFKTTIVLTSIFPLLFSCNKVDDFPGEDISGKSPILVSADNVSPFTRAYLPQGMCDNFKVYAASEKGGNRTEVMNGYEVRFFSEDWTYVNDTQPLMYWSNDADRYLFTAGAPISVVTAISGNSMTLHLENNTTESAMAAEPLKIENSSADYGKTVNLRFGYAHCMVSVAFTRNATEDITVSDIQLTPQAAITSKADLVYSFNWSDTPATSTTEVTSKEKSIASFTFADVAIPSNSENAVVSGTRYYCVPDASNPKDWMVSLKCNGEEKTGSFENTYTWQSGKNYIYVFSLGEKTPKLIEVISQDMKDMYFDCNDIIPGGNFSNTQMTE
ncbi:MAG: fimbrillin family protein [Prevotellaceae bacterium]|nr:fimbrillin family protein [Prevotellaceae bacterium]